MDHLEHSESGVKVFPLELLSCWRLTTTEANGDESGPTKRIHQIQPSHFQRVSTRSWKNKTTAVWIYSDSVAKNQTLNRPFNLDWWRLSCDHVTRDVTFKPGKDWGDKACRSESFFLWFQGSWSVRAPASFYLKQASFTTLSHHVKSFVFLHLNQRLFEMIRCANNGARSPPSKGQPQ